jgi:hypothetical protein
VLGRLEKFVQELAGRCVPPALLVLSHRNFLPLFLPT